MLKSRQLRGKALDIIRDILVSRSFTESQITKVLPTLGPGYAKEPQSLAEIIDCWNLIMGSAKLNRWDNSETSLNFEHVVPTVAAAPKRTFSSNLQVNMNNILADVEPMLLQIHPDKLIRRHEKVTGLGITKNNAEHWMVLYNSPRGFYLQDWSDLTKKLMYIDHKVLDLLYTKKAMKEMHLHPLIRAADIVERDFDQIRSRYLFAHRTGYKELAQMQDVETAASMPDLNDLLTSDDNHFLRRFAPYCSMEEYRCFSKLIKEFKIDEDDADVFENMAELESIKYEAWPKTLKKSELKKIIQERADRQ